VYVRGQGLGRGSLRDRPGLKRKRSWANSVRSGGGPRMYRTGGSGAVAGADGRAGVSGANRFQVKIRGFRVELGRSRVAAEPTLMFFSFFFFCRGGR